ncbi:uncharacterized protein [Thunnus thynnus]|uniref:uncharacterized protein isoform X2 n=1 Tax=Thunnus thynnus TaxID=8237 RepID=UPI003527E9DE
MASYMEFSCFSSSDPRAVNATQLYDYNVAKGNLWMRGGQDIPLPPCSPISPLDGRCLVCLDHQDQSVYAVCRNLMDGVKMVMEAEGEHVKISESKCPKPPSDDTWKWWQIFILIIILIIIIAVPVVYGLWKKCSKTSKCLTRVKGEKAVERVGEEEEEEEEAAHLRRPEMERDAEAAV